jgi:hypothetical protein
MGVLACCYLTGAAVLFYLKGIWMRTWPLHAAQRAGLLPMIDSSAVKTYAAHP